MYEVDYACCKTMLLSQTGGHIIQRHAEVQLGATVGCSPEVSARRPA